MKIENMQAGQLVWETHRYKMGNTTLRTIGACGIRIVSIDLERRTVVASWNGNALQTFREKAWKKWRAERPLLIRINTLGQHRIATREEKAAHEAEQKARAAAAGSA